MKKLSYYLQKSSIEAKHEVKYKQNISMTSKIRYWNGNFPESYKL